MTNLVPTPTLDSVIQLETDTLVLAGPGGVANSQAQALLNRTAFLDLYTAGPFRPGRSYGVNEPVLLTSGDVVKSAVPSNTTNPNVDMTGWIFYLSASFIKDSSGLSQQEVNNGIDSIEDLSDIPSPFDGQRVFVKSYYKAENFALAKPFKGGGERVFSQDLSSRNDGGICINGWTLTDVNDIDVSHFGAYGDWDATDQTGHDDTGAFQNYASYLMTYENNPREGGSRILKVPAGNFRLDGFTITQAAAYWSFNLIGEGQLTQLWFNPSGQGIVLDNENSVFKDITLNGKLNPAYPTVGDPAIPSIVTAKLANKLLDVDFVADNVNVNVFNTFATVSGRGFTFKNSVAGFGQTLFKLNLTNDLIVSGSDSRIHSVESSLRHYNISSNRFDVVDRLYDVIGDADSTLKNYINGVTVSDNELTLVSQIGRTTLAGSRLVSPIWSGNLCIGCFGGQVIHSYGALKNGLDSNNSYYNFINGSVADANSINRMYQVGTIDGLTISKTKAKDLGNMVVHATSSVNNVKISDCTFDNIFDASTGLRSVVYCPNNPTNVDICNNTFNSVNSVAKTYVSSDTPSTLQQSPTIRVKGNTPAAGFVDQSQNPQISVTVNGVAIAGGNYSTRKANFTVKGEYIEMAFSISVVNITDASGNIRITLPVPAIADNSSFSNFYSGSGSVGSVSGMIGSSPVQLQVSANTDQCIKLMTGNSEFNLSAKTSNTLALAGFVRYRFK